ncbi:choline/ethanolamine kinase-like [Tetranychus urticae]|uniref:Aminoglycoside phosphotransferase domain-containing protein n=1 Tax=Tetranychus urticae TaxID=32264 RepID=T1KTL7_TETUR|nr:choline/ethanolamine kinase-like [Tetranychus urticae]
MSLSLNCLTEDDFKLKAKSICRQLLPSSSWKRASSDQIRCSRIKTGQSNRLYICELMSYDGLNNRQQIEFHDDDFLSPVTTTTISNQTSVITELKKSQVPNKVIVRFYGSEFTGEGNQYRSISDELECRILDHLSSIGRAPKVYATFEGGRIDEFLENATLATVYTLRSTPYLRSLAMKIAQFHALQIELPDVDHYEVLNYFETQCIPKMDEHLNSDLSPGERALITQIARFIHSDQLNFIFGIMDNLYQRKVCCHFDLNPTNILVLPSETPQGRPTMDTLLIDFENCQTGFRGLDLGKFFVELSIAENNYIAARTNVASSESQISPVSDAKIREFIGYYLTEWSSISGDFDPSIDNENNLFEEIKFNLMFSLLGFIYLNILNPDFLSKKLFDVTAHRIILYHQFAERWFS